MSRYIDADELIKTISSTKFTSLGANDILVTCCQIVIDNAPTTDVVEVVRCNECIHNVGIRDNTEFYDNDIVCDYWESDGFYSTDFCSYGKRAKA